MMNERIEAVKNHQAGRAFSVGRLRAGGGWLAVCGCVAWLFTSGLLVGCRGERSPEEVERQVRQAIRELLDKEGLEQVRIEQLSIEAGTQPDVVSGAVELIDERSRAYQSRFEGKWGEQTFNVSLELPRLRHLEQQAARTLQASLVQRLGDGYEVGSLELKRDRSEPDHYFGLAELQGPDGSDQCQVDLQVVNETEFQVEGKPLQLAVLLRNLQVRLGPGLNESGMGDAEVRFGNLAYQGNNRLQVFGSATVASGESSRFRVDLELLEGGQYQMEWRFIDGEDVGAND